MPVPALSRRLSGTAMAYNAPMQTEESEENISSDFHGKFQKSIFFNLTRGTNMQIKQNIMICKSHEHILLKHIQNIKCLNV